MNFFNKQSLNKFQVYYNDFTKIDLNRIYHNDEFSKKFAKEFDDFNFFKINDLFQYLIEPFRLNQPKTFNWLKNGNFFYLIKRYDPIYQMSDTTQFGILVNNLACYIKYDKYPYEIYPQNNCIPKEINKSWLYRTRGWTVAEEAVISIYHSILPSTHLMPLDNLTKIKNKQKYFEFMQDKFGKKLRTFEEDADESDDNQYFEMRCLLDTRGMDDFSSTGYQIFTSSHNQKCNLFVIKNADYQTIKMLENPADVIDSYAAHVFETHNTDFDFMKYAVDF